MDHVIILESARARLTVSPDDGGRLVSFVVDGHQLLHTGDASMDPLSWGSYPMVPYAGRVDHGRFRFGGRAIQLPVTHGPHAIHGTGYLARWDRQPDGSIVHEFPAQWPFVGRAVQRFELDDDGATFHLEVHADEPMPVSVGWHPWFVRPVEVEFHAEHMYERDATGIPTGRVITPPAGPWDDCFRDLTADPVLRWLAGPTVTISSNLDRWIVFDVPTHALCVEPQSAAPDSFNHVAQVVVPGEPLRAWMRWSWS